MAKRNAKAFDELNDPKKGWGQRLKDLREDPESPTIAVNPKLSVGALWVGVGTDIEHEVCVRMAAEVKLTKIVVGGIVPAGPKDSKVFRVFLSVSWEA